MLMRFTLVSSALVILSACGGSGTPMTENPDDGDHETFASVLAARSPIDNLTFFQVTLESDLPPGTAEYAGISNVQTFVNRTSDDVTFAAIGLMEAEVDFENQSLSATASSFYEIDPDVLNATGQATSLGAIDGEITVVSGFGSEDALVGLLNDPTVVSLGVGATSGSVTQLDGTELELNVLSGVLFFNANGENAEVLTIGGPSSNGTEPLDVPYSSITMTGQRQ